MNKKRRLLKRKRTGKMTFDEADKVTSAWVEFLECSHDRLMALFVSSIPRSLLPYPKETLEEALVVMRKGFQDSGDVEAANTINESMWLLAHYEDDEKALQGAAFKFSDSGLREILSSNMKKAQDNWIKAQKA